MQLAVIEYARDVAACPARTARNDPNTPYPVVALITEWLDRSGQVEQRTETSHLGGTMRLGGQACDLVPGSLARTIYGKDTIIERHRHRYEVNNSLLQKLEQAGLKVSGRSQGVEHLCEMIELPNHPWFVAVQFHPEFTSTPRYGHPLFSAFIRAAVQQHEQLPSEASAQKALS